MATTKLKKTPLQEEGRALSVVLDGDVYDAANGRRAASRLTWRQVVEQALTAWLSAGKAVRS